MMVSGHVPNDGGEMFYLAASRAAAQHEGPRPLAQAVKPGCVAGQMW